MLASNSPMDTGIYAIEHAQSGKRYIGSTKNFDERWRVHQCLLRNGKHHSPHLQAAWNKYGGAAFLFKKLVVCSRSDLLMYEQRLIDGYQAFSSGSGFNGRKIANSQSGMKHSEETRAKIREKRATQVFSQETRDLWSKNRTGRKMPEWFGEFTRQHRTGYKHTESVKKLISQKGIGRSVSLETREKKSKVSAAQVDEIKSRYMTGDVTQTALAREFSLDPSTISLIVRGKRWCAPFLSKEN